MRPTHQRIIVRVNANQKDEIQIGNALVKIPLLFETNYREKSPVIAEVVEGNERLDEGDIIVCHHNHFHQPSPYYLYDDLFSIPFNKTIFGKFDLSGDMMPLCGNMICDPLPVETPLPLPPELQKLHIDRYRVVDPGWTPYKKGAIVFTRPHAGYVIVYHWNREEKRILKVDSEQVCGYLLS